MTTQLQLIIIIMLCKRKRKEVKIQQFVYRDATNVEPEMYDCTSNNWSHWNSNEKLKEKFGNYTKKTFDRLTYKRQLYLEHHKQYGKYCSVKLEA